MNRVEDGKLYVRRPDGRWELSCPRSGAESKAGRQLTPLEEEARREVLADFRPD